MHFSAEIHQYVIIYKGKLETEPIFKGARHVSILGSEKQGWFLLKSENLLHFFFLLYVKFSSSILKK
jgi:hypothetical protein